LFDQNAPPAVLIRDRHPQFSSRRDFVLHRVGMRRHGHHGHHGENSRMKPATRGSD